MGQIIRADFAAHEPSLSMVPKALDADWSSVATYVDLADLAQGRGAFVFFMDLLVQRPTEFTVLLGMFLDAYDGYARHGLTARQEQAVKLAAEARRLKVNESRYVSDRLAIKIQNARGLLRRAEKRFPTSKIIPFAKKPYIESRHESHIAPSEIDIQRKMAAYPSVCPGHEWNVDCDKKRPPKGKALCWSCNHLYAADGALPDWLAYLVADNRRLAREWAIEQLRTVAVASMDDFDALLAA